MSLSSKLSYAIKWNKNIKQLYLFFTTTFRKSNKELNALIEKKIQKNLENKKRRNTVKEFQHFQEMQISDNETKRSVSSLAESVESGEILSYSYEWKMGLDELFVTFFFLQ